MAYIKYAILVVILALGVWALLPPGEESKASVAHLGSDPSRNQNAAGAGKSVAVDSVLTSVALRNNRRY